MRRNLHFWRRGRLVALVRWRYDRRGKKSGQADRSSSSSRPAVPLFTTQESSLSVGQQWLAMATVASCRFDAQESPHSRSCHEGAR
jgi:hypothetical protein